MRSFRPGRPVARRKNSRLVQVGLTSLLIGCRGGSPSSQLAPPNCDKQPPFPRRHYRSSPTTALLGRPTAACQGAAGETSTSCRHPSPSTSRAANSAREHTGPMSPIWPAKFAQLEQFLIEASLGRRRRFREERVSSRGCVSAPGRVRPILLLSYSSDG